MGASSPRCPLPVLSSNIRRPEKKVAVLGVSTPLSVSPSPRCSSLLGADPEISTWDQLSQESAHFSSLPYLAVQKGGSHGLAGGAGSRRKEILVPSFPVDVASPPEDYWKMRPG